MTPAGAQPSTRTDPLDIALSRLQLHGTEQSEVARQLADLASVLLRREVETNGYGAVQEITSCLKPLGTGEHATAVERVIEQIDQLPLAGESGTNALGVFLVAAQALKSA